MSRTVHDVVADLDAFMAVNDGCGDVDRLNAITYGLAAQPAASTALPALFAVLERHPTSDLGAPGPIVHTIEAIGGHIDELLGSIRRAPVDLTVWMVNRLLNSDLDAGVRESLIDALRDVARNEALPQHVRDSAREYLEFQGA